MALSISCCLNLPPPPSCIATSDQPLASKASHLAWPKNPKERSWKRKCLLGVATLLVGLEMSNLVVGEQEMALAWDLQQQEEMASKSVIKVQRWSDRRTCPSWHVNSLETIVPENLPRPSFRRRWENADFRRTESSRAAQLAAKVVTGPRSCFSL
ncbi:unnamed protein product [Coffea canephora]|uniref:Uncharacterized protein n=2 Tax=Coffea TaxID=13442 RepID=A0A068U8M8_COFCA|nr:uncharacterized protein LOC113707478 [Coffea arabica]CDP04836.1 unnamed protein product [Coffea canephora]